MPKLQPKFRGHLDSMLLGRLKLRLFARIANHPNELPEPRAVRRFILQTLNPCHLSRFVRMQITVTWSQSCSTCSWMQRFDTSDFRSRT